MKDYILRFIITLMPFCWYSGVFAMDYRVVMSPKLQLEAYLDNVESTAAKSWCNSMLELRLNALQSGTTPTDSIQSFIPQVGHLLSKQCPELVIISWHYKDKNGSAVKGIARKSVQWQAERMDRPAGIEKQETPSNQAQETSPVKRQTEIPWKTFLTPENCAFRHYAHFNRQETPISTMLPASKTLKCSTNGWLNGKALLTLQSNGKEQKTAVFFYQGFPLGGITSVPQNLELVLVNDQHIVFKLTHATANVYLQFPYDNTRNLWSFSGNILIPLSENTFTREQRDAFFADIKKTGKTFIAPENKTLSVSFVQAAFEHNPAVRPQTLQTFSIAL